MIQISIFYLEHITANLSDLDFGTSTRGRNIISLSDSLRQFISCNVVHSCTAGPIVGAYKTLAEIRH